ncbi:glucose-6-phosphate isomerase [Methanosarcinaceae archaeon]|nr:glucose-6-phosphate isomerase [Methanosarcinaceae archaeon]
MTLSPSVPEELQFAFKPSVRTLFDLEPVIFDSDWYSDEKEKGNRDIYFMYREGFRSGEDHDIMKENKIRFDITQIPAGFLGVEYVKTMGHYHPKVPGCRYSYPEVYQVISGHATYLLQKRDLSGVIVIEASEGDVVLIPPEFGHVTINASREELVMSNWVAEFSSDYETVLEKHGFAYYVTKDGFVPNPHYSDRETDSAGKLPPISFMTPSDHPEFGLFCGKDMYDLIREPEKLDFLQHPDLYF